MYLSTSISQTQLPELSYKVVLDGPKQMGKTSIMRKLIKEEDINANEEDPSKVRASSSTSSSSLLDVPHVLSHSINIEGPRTVHLGVWERVKEEDKNTTYEGVDAVVIVYSISSKVSYEKAKEKLRKIRHRVMKSRPDHKVVIALVGNKSDLVEQREVEMAEAMTFAKEEGLDICLETSAKTAMNVTGLFTMLAKRMQLRFDPTEEQRQRALSRASASAISLSKLDNSSTKKPAIKEKKISEDDIKKPKKSIFAKIFCCCSEQ